MLRFAGNKYEVVKNVRVTTVLNINGYAEDNIFDETKKIIRLRSV